MPDPNPTKLKIDISCKAYQDQFMRNQIGQDNYLAVILTCLYEPPKESLDSRVSHFKIQKLQHITLHFHNLNAKKRMLKPIRVFFKVVKKRDYEKYANLLLIIGIVSDITEILNMGWNYFFIFPI